MNTFLRNGYVCMILMGLLVAQPLLAKEMHIGFVKTDRIFKEAQSAKAAEVKLTQEFSVRQKQIADREAEFKSAVDKFKVDESTLAESDLLSRQKQLAELDRALQSMRRNFQEDLTARKNEELQQLLTIANKIIKQTAEDQKYDVIFQDAVYVNPKYDITDSVIKALDAQSAR
jgi:outer membrane protein